MNITDDKWTLKERGEYIKLLGSVGLTQEDVSEQMGYKKLEYFQRSGAAYYRKVKFLIALMKLFTNMSDDTPVLVAIQRSYRPNHNSDVAYDILHFKSTMKTIAETEPDIIAGSARIQNGGSGVYTYVAATPSTVKALKSTPTLRINSRD